jgi:hypothetical protein
MNFYETVFILGLCELSPVQLEEASSRLTKQFLKTDACERKKYGRLLAAYLAEIRLRSVEVVRAEAEWSNCF